MRYAICIICTSLLIAGCKPAERTAEESRARFEAKTIETNKKTAQTAPTDERRSLKATFDKRLTDLGTKTNALDPKIRLLTEPNRTTLDTDSANLKVKIEAAKKELVATKSLTADEWNTTRGKLERDISEMERELASITTRVG